jgi:hypothetical protein
MMNERMGSVTVLRCAGCEAHQRRIAELEKQVHELKFAIFKLAIKQDCMKHRVMRAMEEDTDEVNHPAPQ